MNDNSTANLVLTIAALGVLGLVAYEVLRNKNGGSTTFVPGTAAAGPNAFFAAGPAR